MGSAGRPRLLLSALAACVAASSALISPPCFDELRDISVTADSNGALYNESQGVNNPFFNKIPAQFVVLPRDVSDVQRALRCADENGLRVAVKGGGHGFGGYATVGTTGAFVLAFTNFTGISWANSTSSGEPSLRAQAGVRWGEVYEFLSNTSLVAVGGLCPSVGLGGYLQGGGVGPMSRVHGLGSDNVLSFTLVTANGSDVVVANASHNADLYFALRGSGGGNYGVVVDMTLRLHPAPQQGLTWSLLCYNSSDASRVFTTVAGMVTSSPGMPLDVNVDIVAASPKGNGSEPAVCVWAIVHGDEAYSNSSLAPLLPPAMQPVPANSSVAAYPSFLPMIEAYAVAHGYGEFSSEPYASKNCLVNASALSDARFIAANAALLASAPPSCSMHWIQFGGAVKTAAAPNATAFPWRQAEYMAYAVCGFTDAPSYTVADAYLNDWRAGLASWCIGSYVNFLDPSQLRAGWGAQYYGPNLPALVGIKQRWAPPGATPLRFAQEIAPSALGVGERDGVVDASDGAR